MAEYFFTILEETHKVLIFIPKVKAFSMKQIVLKIPEIVLILREDFESKSISPSIFESPKI